MCANQKIIQGYNDLNTIYPNIAEQWDYTKNDKFPTEVAPKSAKKYWWKCDKGHSWEASINTRVKGSGCPYCSGRNAIQGYNDLKTKNPELSKEWNYEKNKNLKPENFMPNSHHKVWWKCNKCDNEWMARISDRNRGRGCPMCRKKLKN